MSYGPWGHKQWDMTEKSTHTHTHTCVLLILAENTMSCTPVIKSVMVPKRERDFFFLTNSWYPENFRQVLEIVKF